MSGGKAGQAITKEIPCFFCVILRDLDKRQSVDLSRAAGVKAARPKRPRHLPAVACSCPGAFVMDSHEPELFNVPLTKQGGPAGVRQKAEAGQVVSPACASP